MVFFLSFVVGGLVFVVVLEIVRRIVGRRSDPETGRIYHVEFDPPENEEGTLMMG